MTLWPNGSKTKPKVSSSFGPRKPVKLPNGQYSTSDHQGCDFVGFSKVKAVRGGKVTLSSSNFSGYGGCVIVRFTAESGSTVDILYGHLASRAVKAGQIIDEGDDIGVMGDTGNAWGKNLHLEVRYYTGGKLSHRDPEDWIGGLIAAAKPAKPTPTPAGNKPKPKPKSHPPTIRRGSRGPTVLKLQKILVKRNHPMKLDSIFGPRVEEVVEAVQRNAGIKVDGICGPATWTVLGQ